MDSELPDFDQYFDFDQAGLVGVQYEQDADASLASQLQDYIASSPHQLFPLPIESKTQPMVVDEICTAVDGIASPAINADALASFADFADFSNWLPRYSKPAVACENCSGKRLECYFTFDHQTACSPCESLFRPCSFTASGNANASTVDDGMNRVNTLHSVTEHVCQTQGAQTALRPPFASGATMNDVLGDLAERQPDKRLYRFSRLTIRVLKDWLNEHLDNPNPSDQEKDELTEQTGLTKVQISNWFANARRRGKARSNHCVSPGGRYSRSKPVDIPKSERLAEMTPLDRWKESPPESEPASMSAIARAVATTQYPRAISGSSSMAHSFNGQRRDSSTGSGFSAFGPQSTSSFETGKSDGSQRSYGSAWSHSSDRGSFTSFARRKHRRPRKVPQTSMSTLTGSQAPRRPFQCTFCTATFQNKYDWVRHEKSVHITLEKWICAPLGPVVTHSADGTTQCVFCELINPSQEHINSHQHHECQEKGLGARTFARKDHLRQHLKLVHNVPLTPSMEIWKWAPAYVRSRCGLCPTADKPTIFTTWQDRVDHLAKHFKEGAQMLQWTGDWGFEPCIAQMITNAMPPFMIGNEARAPNPFNPELGPSTPFEGCEPIGEPIGDLFPGPGKPNLCWQILTVMLGKFVKSQQESGHAITDDMLQRQARMIVFGNNDGWNQTAADNPQWLSFFKQAHGLMDMSQVDLLMTTVSGVALTDEFPQPPQFQRENLMRSIQSMPQFDNNLLF